MSTLQLDTQNPKYPYLFFLFEPPFFTNFPKTGIFIAPNLNDPLNFLVLQYQVLKSVVLKTSYHLRLK